MIEIGLGFLAIVAGAAIAFGLTEGLLMFPLGNGAVAIAFVLGVALLLRGLYRLARRRATTRLHDLRSRGLAFTVAGAAVLTAMALPAIGETLNLVSIAGFPLGHYLMAQGALLMFVALLFVVAARQSRIDETDEP